MKCIGDTWEEFFLRELASYGMEEDKELIEALVDIMESNGY